MKLKHISLSVLFVFILFSSVNASDDTSNAFSSGSITVNQTNNQKSVTTSNSKSLKDYTEKAMDSSAIEEEEKEEETLFGKFAKKVKKVAKKAKQKIKKAKNTVKEVISDGKTVLKNVGSTIFQHVVPYGKTISAKLYAKKVSKFVDKSITIPGHDDKNFICQGITYLNSSITDTESQKTKDGATYALISLYPKGDSNEEPSQIIAVDLSSGEVLRRFGLYSKKDKTYTGHAGGITVAGEYLWVASGRKIHGFSTQEILDFINDKDAKKPETKPEHIPNSINVPAMDLIASEIYTVDSKASFVSFDGKYIWVGDFIKSTSSYKPIKHHTTNQYGRKTWIAGYATDKTGKPTSTTTYTYKEDDDEYTAHKPDLIICCRESVQGMSVCDDYIALSLSFGPTTSKLAFYKSPIGKKGDNITYKPADKSYTVKGYELSDKKNYLDTVKLAAGSEDLDFDGKYLYVTFESSSPNYSGSWQKMGAIIENKFYLIDYNKILD